MPNILLMHYFSGAGGKFIVNCLSLSGQVAITNYQLALSYQHNKNIAHLEKALLDTIPPRNQSKTWLELEHGCLQLFGKDIDKIKNGLAHTNDLFDLGFLKYNWLPIVSHNKDVFNNIKKHFVNYKIFTVSVMATPDFIDCSIRLKWPQQHHCLDLDLLKEFNYQCQFLEFDHCIVDWDPRQLNQHRKISNLSQTLNVDYNPTTANNYIRKYLDFYQS
jgi:hypothetical protein